jgi:4'-phosphopantetheinyl transferase
VKAVEGIVTSMSTVPEIWLVDVTEHRAGAVAAASEVLDADERHRAAAFPCNADRDAYLVTHVALRRLLASHLSVAPQRLVYTRSLCADCGEPHGRPRVLGSPLYFSLSHTLGFGVLAFAQTPLGVDVEAVPDSDRVGRVAGTLHPREMAELELLPPAERATGFTRIWTRKEAYLKALGTGLTRDPAVDYVGISGPDPDGWAIYEVTMPLGYQAAVAMRVGRRDLVRPYVPAPGLAAAKVKLSITAPSTSPMRT